MRDVAWVLPCALALAGHAPAQDAPSPAPPPALDPSAAAPPADTGGVPETLTITTAESDERPSSAPGSGAAPEGRPASAGRIVRVFDFEERWTNASDLPAYWVRAQHDPDVPRLRPGFPRWNHAALDYQSPAARGEGSVRLPTQGGSTSLRLDPGVLPIFPGADYVVYAVVRTEGLVHARARIAVRQLAADGAPIEGTELATDALQSPGAWAPLELRISGTAPDAAFLQVDLELLQPRNFADAIEGVSLEQDFSGSAWFDDVAVLQAPRTRFIASGAGGVVVAPEAPRFELHVRDLTGEGLTARLTLWDDQGTLVAEQLAELGVGRGSHTWSPTTPRLGWYRCIAEVMGPEGVVASGVADVLVAPPSSAGGLRQARDRARFGVWLGRGAVEDLPETLRRLGVGSVVLPFWEPGQTPGTVSARVSELLELRGALHRASIDVGVALVRTPDRLALETGVDADDPLGALAAGAGLWQPWAAELFERLGQGTERWSMGTPGSGAGWRDPRLGAHLAAARQSMSPFAPAPTLMLGWRATEGIPPDLLTDPRAGIEVLVPHQLPASSIADLAAGLLAPLASDAGPSESASAALTLVIEPQPWSVVGPRAAAEDTARRALEALAALPARPGDEGYPRTRLALLDPWSGPLEGMGPAPSLGAWRTLNEVLVGRAPAGSWRPAPGVRLLFMEPRDDAEGVTGAVAIWADRADGEAYPLRIPLALGPIRAIDVFGNARTIEPEPGEQGRLGVHPVDVSASPVLLEGVDLELVRFIASVRLDPPLVAAGSVEREHRVVFDNPWPTDLSGRALVVQPGGREAGDQPAARDRSWDIMPRAAAFSVGAGARESIPLTITLSPGVESGQHEAVLDLEIGAQQRYGLVRVRQPIEVGLDYLDVRLVARRGVGGADAIVEAHITNTGLEPIDIEASAYAPGVGRIRAAGLRLGPGQRAVRVFPFEGAEALAGQRAVVGVVDRTHEARLNTSIELW